MAGHNKHKEGAKELAGQIMDVDCTRTPVRAIKQAVSFHRATPGQAAHLNQNTHLSSAAVHSA